MCRGRADIPMVDLRASWQHRYLHNFQTLTTSPVASGLATGEVVSLSERRTAAKSLAAALQTINMPIIHLQPGGQLTGPTQPDRAAFNIHQQPGALQPGQLADIFQPAIGNHQ